jgi:K+-sensing histidine kinase KdpD
MGIGLSVCGSIIKAHNGVFEAENRPDGGAVFRVCLPMNQETEVNNHE